MAAVTLALTNRISIIQGPFGTGKTVVMTALVANWMKETEIPPRILLCAPSNTAADMIADRMRSIPALSNKFIRFYSEKREDMFNITPENIIPDTLFHKMLFCLDED